VAVMVVCQARAEHARSTRPGSVGEARMAACFAMQSCLPRFDCGKVRAARSLRRALASSVRGCANPLVASGELDGLLLERGNLREGLTCSSR
jgi:hypothetical protein